MVWLSSKKMRSKLVNFLRLSSFERVLFLRAFYLLHLVELHIRFFSFRKALAGLDSFTSKVADHQTGPESPLQQAYRTAWLVKQAACLGLLHSRCLAQSLVLWHLLQRQGINAEIRVGVSKDNPQQPFAKQNFNAHAWVVCQGQPLQEQPDINERYIVLSGTFPI